MSDELFDYPTDLNGNNQDTEFKVLSSQFGDGYEQHVSVGINNKRRTWVYQRTYYKTEIDEIEAFFLRHKGADSFNWLCPYIDSVVRVKTDLNYQKTQIGGNVWRISTNFKEVFY